MDLQPCWNGQFKVVQEEMRMAMKRSRECDSKDMRKRQLKREFKARQQNCDRHIARENI